MTNKTVSTQILDFFFKTSNVEFYFHNWIRISSADFKIFLEKNNNIDMSMPYKKRSLVVEFIIEKINNNYFGAGQCYEIFSERLSDEIRYLCSLNVLTQDEESRLKQNFDYYEICDEVNDTVNILTQYEEPKLEQNFDCFEICEEVNGYVCDDCNNDISDSEEYQRIDIMDITLCQKCLGRPTSEQLNHI
tara:strand:+ start:1404 stop:1973 length:570 start_codon:yes stop_codon:yes gene_type:complete